MTKVSQDHLNALGKAVKRERIRRGWTLETLGTEVDPPMSRSLLSKIENGRKPNVGAMSVSRIINALKLDEALLEPFFEIEETEDAEETKNERDADRMYERAKRDGSAEGTSDDLLIDLANRFADGRFTDLETSYTGLRKALEAAENIRKRGEMPPDNTGSQLNAVMKEVAALNDLGDVDQADALLDAEEKRMFEAHKAEKERLDEQARQLLEQRLDQDRLRNDPTAAADRLIRDLIRQTPPGGVNRALSELWFEWSEKGRAQGDPFELRVSLVLANRLYQRAKRGQQGVALTHLSYARVNLGERQPGVEMLEKAEEAARAAVKALSKTKDPLGWGYSQTALGNVLLELGERRKDAETLRAACGAFRKALSVRSKTETLKYWGNVQDDLGNGLRALGEFVRDADVLREAVEAHFAALEVWDPVETPEYWAASQNNLGVSRRWLGEVAEDIAELDRAKQHFDDCLTVWTKNAGSFSWAMAQWNLGDLALARFALEPDPVLLDTAEEHVQAAREVFEIGSDYQTARCDDLLEKINAARTGGGAAG